MKTGEEDETCVYSTEGALYEYITAEGELKQHRRFFLHCVELHAVFHCVEHDVFLCTLIVFFTHAACASREKFVLLFDTHTHRCGTGLERARPRRA